MRSDVRTITVEGLAYAPWSLEAPAFLAQVAVAHHGKKNAIKHDVKARLLLDYARCTGSDGG